MYSSVYFKLVFVQQALCKEVLVFLLKKKVFLGSQRKS